MSFDAWWATAKGKIREQLLVDMMDAGCDFHDGETEAAMRVFHEACLAAFLIGGAAALKYKAGLDGEPGPLLN